MWGARIRQEEIFIDKSPRKKDFIFLIEEFITIVLFNINPAHQAAYVTCQLCLSGSKMKDLREKVTGLCIPRHTSLGLELNHSDLDFLEPKLGRESLSGPFLCPKLVSVITMVSSNRRLFEYIHAGNTTSAQIHSLDLNIEEKLSASAILLPLLPVLSQMTDYSFPLCIPFPDVWTQQ